MPMPRGDKSQCVRIKCLCFFFSAPACPGGEGGVVVEGEAATPARTQKLVAPLRMLVFRPRSTSVLF